MTKLPTAIRSPFRNNKYRSKATKIDGINFPSKLEANCYAHLKLLQASGCFRFFLRQVSFDIPGPARHKVDFAVFYDDRVLFIEAKGRDLALGRLKRKQVEAIYGIQVHVVKTVNEIYKAIK